MKLTELQTQWIDTLRSGKYPQGEAYLCHIKEDRGEELFCCLGVFCELVGYSRIPKKTLDGCTYAYIFSKKPYTSNCSQLERPAHQKLGLYDACGGIASKHLKQAAAILKLDVDPDQLNLTWLNDHGFDFNQIADLLETYPHWFFNNEHIPNENPKTD